MTYRRIRLSLSASCLRYAGLVLVAFLSRDAVAQTGTTMEVTYQPGEFSKSVSVPRIYSTGVTIHTPGYICSWPTPDQIKVRLAAGAGLLTQRLNQMEGYGSAGARDIVLAMNVIMGVQVNGLADPVGIVSGGHIGSDRTGNVPSGGYLHTFARRCVDEQAARAGLFEIRRLIRAYLGLPAPTVAPTVFEIPAPTTPAAGAAPTSLGTPAPAQAR